MTSIDEIKVIEDQIEKALWDLEVHEQLEQALEIYSASEKALLGLSIHKGDAEYPEQQRVLSYCLMRRGNILRQLGKPQEALALGEREIEAARASGDEIALGRSLMSVGTNYIVSAKVDDGLLLLEQSRLVFERGDSYDHRQGVGWYWILQADLVNAGLLEKAPSEVVEMATHALEILEPIENWPGVARAYAARAKAHEKMGEGEEAASDRQAQKISEGKIDHAETQH